MAECTHSRRKVLRLSRQTSSPGSSTSPGITVITAVTAKVVPWRAAAEKRHAWRKAARLILCLNTNRSRDGDVSHGKGSCACVAGRSNGR